MIDFWISKYRKIRTRKKYIFGHKETKKVSGNIKFKQTDKKANTAKKTILSSI